MARIKNILNWNFLTQLFRCSRPTWNNWKKENRPIVTLLEKYFSNEELVEFLETGKIKKLERIPELLETEKRFNEIVQLVNKDSQ